MCSRVPLWRRLSLPPPVVLVLVGTKPEAAPTDDGSDLDSLFNDSQADEDFEGFTWEVDALQTESAPSDGGAEAQ